MNTYETHMALLGKNAGCIEKLRGKVLLVFFLVDDAKSKWDDLMEQKYKKVIQNACLRLMKESGLPTSQLYISYANCRASVPYEVTQKNFRQMMTDVLRSYGCKNAQSFQEAYRREMGKDEVCVSFVLNKYFTSFAQRIISSSRVMRTPTGRGDELSVVSFRKFDLKGSERSLIHELMHQFGAMDYYTPAFVEEAANKYLPRSIMNDGNEIDALTRYVIGWDDTLTPEAIAFLKATALLK